MAISAEDKAQLRVLWDKVAGREDYGAEAIGRMFETPPPTKTHIPHFNRGQGSPQVELQDKKIIDALTDAVNNIDDLPGTLSDLSDLGTQASSGSPSTSSS
ncbi:hemoglobin subunit alpha-A-like [Apodemus sylvaticus]|uniref:hemoglobin subunit alpha-A-like n=1 Tax=Apodemus sylvaticus TaxID=10129 RepID=UPI002242C332|nr:hemoglobin subunit alpha-A-like [Apodemus sylvaticus]XP_052053552.1 hemoglobin subunit alpha-A-like [Apodemus sylvaticus]